MKRIAFALVALVALSMDVRAGQTLIPSPYPNTAPGAQPLDPGPERLGAPQQLKLDPYPQILGDNAQGNPPIYRHRRHQRLVPSIYQRKYRVDRR